MFRNYVSAQDGPQNCKACRQVFKEVWDETREKWLLDQAAKIKYEENNIENCLIGMIFLFDNILLIFQ